MLQKIYFFGLVFVTIVGLIFTIMAFVKKDFIINSAYTRATEEERAKMNKKAYNLQTAITFFLLTMLSLVNALRMYFGFGFLYYLSVVILVALVVYYIVSNKKLKK